MAFSLKAPGKYVQGEGELHNLGLNVKKLGKHFLIVCSGNNEKRIGPAIIDSLQEADCRCTFYRFSGECSFDEIEKVVQAFQEARCDAIIGAGGGKALDTAKGAAETLGGVPLAIVPTVASNDAPCSGVAVVYNEKGVVVKSMMMRRNPDVVLVDIGVIAKAPARLFAAGMGDALATYFETRACCNSGAKNMAHGYCTHTAYMMSKLCYELLLENGIAALESVEKKIVTPALESAVEANILLSGVGFESGGLAVAHAVNDGLDLLPETHDKMHGEKVAFGLLTQLVLEGKPMGEWDAVLAFLKNAHLPVTFADLGLNQPAAEDLLKVGELAASPKQFSKNLRSGLTAQDIIKAMQEADAAGQKV